MLRHISKIVLVLLLVFCGVAGKAQTITGAVNGTVTDLTGAVIPNAHVTVTNLDTNVQNAATTNEDGIYNIRFLPIGRYNIAIESSGFATQTLGPVTIETGQNVKADGKLSVQGQQITATVEANVQPLLNTDNATLATTLDQRAIENLPIVGNDFVALTMFVPGAVSTNPSGFASGAPIGNGGNQVSVNGNRQQTNNYMLDGIDINETLNNGVGYNPAPQALQQIQIISANANAEFGNVNGGDVIALTKSGTNQVHGSAYFLLNDAKLNANTWANKHKPIFTPRSPFTQSFFGGTLGFPIFKDKFFLFGDYYGQRRHSGGTGTATVATALMRGCAAGSTSCTGGTIADFSELQNPGLMCSQSGGTCPQGNANLFQLYNGTGNTYTVGNNTVAPFQAFPGNRIPLNNPVMRYLFAHPELYPLPNQPAAFTNTPASNNYSAPTKARAYNDQFDVKGDWNITQKDRLSIRYSQSDSGSTSTPVLLITFPTAPTNPVRGVAINEVHTFSSSVVNEFRAGYTRIQSNGAVTLDPTGVFGTNGDAVVGIANVAQAFAGFSAMSQGTPPSPSGITSSGNGTEYSGVGNANTGTNFTDNTFVYADTLTWLTGKHTFKFGVQFQRQQQNNFYPGNDGSVGGFYFLGAATGTPNSDPNGYAHNGYNFADNLLDQASFVSKGGVSGPAGMRSWRDGYFAQDDWKVTPNLTLNLGIRYDYAQPIYEVNNKMSTIDLNNPSRIIIAGSNAPTAAQLSQFPVGANVVSASAAGYPIRSLVYPYYGGVEPRVGFSWAATPHAVVRGGYGVQNYMEGTGANLRMTTNLPFQSAYEASGSPATAGTPAKLFQVENGFGGNTTAASSGGVYNVWDPHIKPAYIHEYSLTMEYQVGRTASLQVGYLGESGQHLITANSANQLTGPCIVGGVPVSGATSTPSATCRAQRPAPFQDTPTVGYNGTVRKTASNAMMNYNALQASFRQRAWHGLQYTVNYTYSRAMTNSTGFYGVPSISAASAYAENYYDLHSEYGPAGQDVRNAVNWNMVYDLPLGKGRMYGANMNRVLDEVIGGWRVAMSGVEYTGFPVNFSVGTGSGGSPTLVNGAGTQRPNRYRALKIVNRSLNNWFGTDPSATPCTTPGVDNGVCAYGAPMPGTFGTARVDSERAPGFQQYNASVTKDFTIWHEHQINFRADADNVLNQTELGNPNNTASSSTFGQITSTRSGPREMQLSVTYHF